MTHSADDHLLRAAGQLFDSGDFLAAHEVLDDLWEATSGPEEDFYKGLIQASIALHHLTSGNEEGAMKLEKGTRRLLAAFLPRHRGIDVEQFLAQLRTSVRGEASSLPQLQITRT